VARARRKFELVDNDKDFVFMPDEVMSAVEATAEEKEIGVGEMMKLIWG